MNADNPDPQGSRTQQGNVNPAQTAPVPSTSGSGRYAVYDLRYERFVGEVTDTKPKLADAKASVGHDDVEIREV